MDEKTWIKLGDQTAGNLRASQSTYMLAVSALTATIVFGADGSDSGNRTRERRMANGIAPRA